MADDDFNEPDLWDEYQWERFLQQQDRNTEKYFGLLEKYIDHPERDRIIAREMGWEALEEGVDEEWEEAADIFCEMEVVDGEEPFDEDFEAFVSSPLYGETLQLHTWVNNWLAKHPQLKDDAEAVRLASRCALCGAKVAAALCGDDGVEVGMTIAYLKRGLKAAHDALDAGTTLVNEGKMTVREQRAFAKRLFRVRDRVIDLMSQYRTEWRKRKGSD